MKKSFSRFNVFFSVTLTLCVFAFILACSPQTVDSIQREDLFSLDIGPMEDQIALYGLEGDGGNRKSALAMRDGFFYITDGGGGKIVRYNSYGDLLFMIYNEETNPKPMTLKPGTDDNMQATRWSFTYPLRSPGKIAVDSRKHIYVEEQLPYDRHGFDEENRALLDRIILHFDSDGRFIEYLGQGGQGGGPFPHITGLFPTEENEIAVVCRLPTGWNIYWYSSRGEQPFLVRLKNDSIPFPPGWPDYTASIDAIMAAPEDRKLYIKVDYYRDVFDESTNTRSSTEPVNSLIWILNAANGVYESHVEVPFYESSYTENGRTNRIRLLYSMLGIVRGSGIMLYYPVENGYNILLMDSEGQRQRHSFIEVNPAELRFNEFHLSPEGILSALLADEWNLKVVWWRMDQFTRDTP